MGVCNSPNIFQENISNIFIGFNTVRAYIDYAIVITRDGFADHLKGPENVLQKLTEAGLKLNAKNSFFGRMETKDIFYSLVRMGKYPYCPKYMILRRLPS